ncbi:MAG: TonB-dependent receptor, partial [Prevotella sp.]|nr:TonB-dependent receptor [Prevotella sp.]
MNRIIILTSLILACIALKAQNTDTLKRQTLNEVQVKSTATGVSRLGGAENGTVIGQEELFRAACCNLGESFVTNPSVDVNYSDAAVGARQIKLLGLSGEYVQMLIEGLPTFAGAATPYELGYVPGAWMKSISVSKGAASVKSGFQSITGQIDVEYIKPDEEPGVALNLYTDSRLKTEGNMVANVHLNKYLSTELLLHGEKDWMHHDVDKDGWHDYPGISQLHMQNRWKYRRGRYIFHGGIGMVRENRDGGQLADFTDNPYRVLLDANRYEAYMKHALLLNKEHNTNIALMANESLYNLDGKFGLTRYTVAHNDLHAKLIFEHEFNEKHQLSTGLSLWMQSRQEELNNSLHGWTMESPIVYRIPGCYAEYTFKPSYRLTMMAGLRADYISTEQIDNSLSFNNMFFTPRLHVKWMATDWVTLRLSSGKGYRMPHALAEHHYLLASGRGQEIDHVIFVPEKMEEAWNSGISAAFYVPIGEQTLKLNAEYYYTHFLNQLVVDYDSDPTKIQLVYLEGPSYSNTVQVDASMDLNEEEWEVMAALRLNDVKCTYSGQLMEKPLTSRYKGLLTVAWKPYMGLWRVDATLQMNGGGRMPTPYLLEDGTPSWDETFPAYPQLNLQITRTFRHWSVYLGSENLTNYKQPHPIINVTNPWSDTFEPTMIWGPVHGIMV